MNSLPWDGKITLPCSTNWNLSTNVGWSVGEGLAGGVTIATLTNKAVSTSNRTIRFYGFGFAASAEITMERVKWATGRLRELASKIIDVDK